MQESPAGRDNSSARAFAGRLRIALGRRSPASVARALGYAPQTFDRWVKDRIPRADDGFRIADELGVDARWLMTGEGNPTPGEMVYLPQFAVEASAGTGAVVEGGHSNGAVAFRADWLRQVGVSPRHAHVLFARGDSMEPTIRDGDLLIIDRSIDRVVDAGIYVCTVGGMVVVKRVQIRRDGTLVLKSDNGHYDDEIIPPGELESVTIEGRVCWSGRPM